VSAERLRLTGPLLFEVAQEELLLSPRHEQAEQQAGCT